MSAKLVITISMSTFMLGCVSSSKFEKVESELRASQGRESQLQKDIEKSQLQKQDLETLVGQLERKLGRASDDQASLKASIVQMKEALAEATRRKLETEKRMKNYKRLADKLKSFTETGQLSVKIVDGRMVVALPGDVLFSSGSSSLSSKGKETIRKVGGVLKTIDERKFQVEGHTDNVPIKTSKFPSNWELAASRATNVVKEMVDSGMAKERISAASFSFFRPVASNDTPEGRELNRRIEIVIVPDMSALPGYEELQKLSDDQNQKAEGE
ncbi:MAG: flagellar motor protein MotB [Bdellovibrionales bacterium]|nr:flagellar motor protein MotB [Bdellovibrionales bacterium]